ncbi:MAG: phosphoribosylaminoimidazolesuccinocarboxamide synthase [Ignavibacteriales bacterium]|nr:phosphoribosylaminoimidazolesuccinocarboxamide synthase [Ignavibacteriales bacterium]
MQVVLQTNLPNLKLFKRGKVRDVYEVDDYYLIISTDRLSAFDVIMNQGIPRKGEFLTKISKFWFDYTHDVIDNHLVTTNVDGYPVICREHKDILEGRSMLVKKAKLIQLECIVRGYISGSGWNDYKKTGAICGIKLPEGLQESEKLPEPIFTPSTKAEIGDHDENITEEQAKNIIGADTYEYVKDKTISVYKKCAEYAFKKGIIIADTKMEFGFYGDNIILIDELLTPDSSRFWPKDKYEKGRAQESFDKQYVRDYLLSINFNKKPPAPILPDEVILNTSKKYEEALNKLIL